MKLIIPSVCYVPATMQNTFHGSHLNLVKYTLNRFCDFFSHSTGMGTEAQRGKVAGLGSHTQLESEDRINAPVVNYYIVQTATAIDRKFILKAHPWGDGLWRRGLWKWLGHKPGTLVNDIRALMMRPQRASLPLLLSKDTARRWWSMNGKKHYWTLDPPEPWSWTCTLQNWQVNLLFTSPLDYESPVTAAYVD